MHEDLVRCAQLRRDKIIVLQEKKTVVHIDNPKQHPIQVIQVDGCVIRDCERVDHALRREGSGDVIVELKGGNVEKACAQVESTIARWKEYGYREGRLLALVVSTRRPNVATDVQIRSRRILKNHGVVTRFVSSGKQIDISDLLPDPPKKKPVKRLSAVRKSKVHDKAHL